MAGFSYSARTKAGVIQKGTLFALDRGAAAASLLDKGLVPILIKESGGTKTNGGLLAKLTTSKVKLTDKVIFSRQFATMINAGVPIAQSLSILKEQSTSKTLTIVIGEVAVAVEGGATLANALSMHPEVFSQIYINMVRAGETGGILDQVLERLAVQQEKDAEIVSKVKSAMIYPGVITAATVAAFFFLMTVIVPKLAAIFVDSGIALPIYTQIMLSISSFMVHDWYLLVAGFVGVGIAFTRFRKTRSGQRAIDKLLLKMPIIGPILMKVNIARFSRTFGSLMASGISVLDAIDATANALGSSVYRDALIDVARQVKNGRPMSEPIRKNPIFPAIVGQMIAVGEETGQLDTILLKLADFYEREVDAVIAGITSIIEPILILVLGTMVGFIVISVFGPISAIESGTG